MLLAGGWLAEDDTACLPLLCAAGKITRTFGIPCHMPPNGTELLVPTPVAPVAEASEQLMAHAARQQQQGQGQAQQHQHQHQQGVDVTAVLLCHSDPGASAPTAADLAAGLAGSGAPQHRLQLLLTQEASERGLA
jgi:hypothetical protein